MKQKKKISFHIKEKSTIARLAAWKLNSDAAAIVLGNTIYLHHIGRNDFLKNKSWLRHELKHIEQFSRFGFIPFIFLYVFETLRHGYTKNKYEIEARKAEKDDHLLTSINFVEKRKIKYFGK